jgi:hypothetical protein
MGYRVADPWQAVQWNEDGYVTIAKDVQHEVTERESEADTSGH